MTMRKNEDLTREIGKVLHAAALKANSYRERILTTEQIASEIGVVPSTILRCINKSRTLEKEGIENWTMHHGMKRLHTSTRVEGLPGKRVKKADYWNQYHGLDH